MSSLTQAILDLQNLISNKLSNKVSDPILSLQFIEHSDKSYLNLSSNYEKLLVSSWAVERKKTFLMGRYVANLALSKIGEDNNFIIKNDSQGRPIWTSSVTGAITHLTDCAASLVSNDRYIKGIGIDLENRLSQAYRISKKTMTIKELEFSPLPGLNVEQTATLIFSYKESFYKATSQLTAKKPTWSDLSLSPSLEKNSISYSIESRSLPELKPFEIHFFHIWLSNSLVLTAVVVKEPYEY